MRRIHLSPRFGGSFARVCIEMDVLQPRQEKIWVGWGDHCQVVEVIYERVPHFCSNCKMLGHSLDFRTRNGQPFRATRRGPQRQDAYVPQSSNQQPQGPRSHGKVVVSDSPLQAHNEPHQGVTSDPPPSSDTDFTGLVSKRPRRRPVLRKDLARPISTKNYYEILQDLLSESSLGDSSGGAKPRPQRFKTLLGKLEAEQNAAVSFLSDDDLDPAISSLATDMVDVASTSVAVVSAHVVVPAPVVELAPSIQEFVGDPPVSIALSVGTPASKPLPSLAFDLGSDGGVTGVVASSPTECLSLPLPGRTRSQQRRYYRNKALQSSLPYGRPPESG
ncbi:uncharacterized protein [Primulina huaijiensis]|uniref:uncharacterized protein n=1 Tax=Primulina huaijiensis TaxID=1492673 RepID=UPI003CC72D8C